MSVIPTYLSPLAGYANAPPLPDERNEDGKSYKNPPREGRSEAYDRFVEPLDNGRRGGLPNRIRPPALGAHPPRMYSFLLLLFLFPFPPDLFFPASPGLTPPNPVPELRIYTLWDRPLGPHPVAMFEVNLLTPAQFGAFVAWLAVWRGPLSVLVHPNTVPTADERAAGVDEVAVERRDHSERAIWMGERIPLDFAIFDNAIVRQRRSQQQQQQKADGVDQASS
ncbi:DOPA-like domain-containing protein [Apiospora phragmitis]|uniref:DOPA-like domain-containing protein n=1 Tax=Apiospora phragmitis TaxID=2905665 RepID=A0ABR1W5S4_9PEZI